HVLGAEHLQQPQHLDKLAWATSQNGERTEVRLTLCWREPDSNHRSLSYDEYPNGLKKPQNFGRKGHPRAGEPVKCAGGAAILTIEWFEGNQCHARTLYRNPTRRE